MTDSGNPGDIRRKKGRPAGKQKEGRTISCYLRDDLYNGLAAYCDETGLSKTAVIERAVQDFLGRKYLSQVQDQLQEGGGSNG